MAKRVFVIGLVIAAILVPSLTLAQDSNDSFISINSTNTTESFYLLSGNLSSLLILRWFSNLPGRPTDFTITQIGTNSVNITWTMGTNADTTVIRGRSDRYASGVTDGYEIYNGSGTWVVVEGLTLDSVIYYYRAWSHNSYGYSIYYAQANTGGRDMVMFTFLILPLGLLGLFLWKKQGFLAFGSAGGWILMAFLSFQTSGSNNPTSITDIYMAFFWLSIILAFTMVLLPVLMREKTPKEEEPLSELGEDLSQFVPKKETKETERKPKPSRFSLTGR